MHHLTLWSANQWQRECAAVPRLGRLQRILSKQNSSLSRVPLRSSRSSQSKYIIMHTTIEKYGNRNWAVRIDGELLAVTVYKKGAKAIVEFVERMTTTKGNSKDLVLPKCGS